MTCQKLAKTICEMIKNCDDLDDVIRKGIKEDDVNCDVLATDEEIRGMAAIISEQVYHAIVYQAFKEKYCMNMLILKELLCDIKGKNHQLVTLSTSEMELHMSQENNLCE